MMATIRLSDSGNKHASTLISSGSVNKKSAPWSFEADVGNTILGDPPDWDAYGSWHLGIRTGTSRKSRKAYAYPFGKGGQVYRSALVAIRSRSAQQGHGAVFEAAGSLLQAVDGEVKRNARDIVAENIAAMGALHAADVPLEVVDLADSHQVVIMLLPYTGGEPADTIDGRELRVTDDSLELIQNAFNARSNPLLLDYDHGTYNPFLPMASLAAGWIFEVYALGPDADLRAIAEVQPAIAERVETYGPGVYALVDLTETAAEKIRTNEYRYLSPVVRVDEEQAVTELLGAGLTNDPNLDGMMPVAARRENADADSSTTELETQTTEGDEMDYTAISAQLGRTISSPEELLEAVEALKSKGSDAETLAAQVATLEAEKLTREAGEAVDAAIAEQRLAKGQRDWGIALYTADPDAWTSYLAATPKGTFAEKALPDQTTIAADNDNDGGEGLVSIATNLERPINQDGLRKLEKATLLAREKFGGDLARGLRAARR